MPIVTRSESYPFDSEDITLVCIKEPKETYPDYVATRMIAGYSPFFEAYTPNSDGSRNQWKSFEHYKSEQASLAGGSSSTVQGEPVGFYPDAYSVGVSKDPFVGYVRNSQFTYSLPYGDPGSLDQDLPPLYLVDGAGHFVAAPSALAELEGRAFKALLPLIKAELSLPNFIYELKDFRSVIKSLALIVKSGSFLAALSALLVPKDLSFAGLMRTAAGKYLNLQFNWLPLVSDIGKIYLALKRTEARINDFVTRSGRVQTKHFNFAFTEFPDVEDAWSFGNRVGSQFLWILSETGSTRQVTYDPSLFHAQIQYNYNYTGYQTEHARLLGTLDALGINLNPAIIWNALPWTFVVDWVLGVGQYLDSLKVGLMDPQINIHKYLWSIRRSRLITVKTEIRNAYNKATIVRRTLPTVRQTAYRRHVGVVPTSSIESSGLTLKEVSLGAALVIARKR